MDIPDPMKQVWLAESQWSIVQAQVTFVLKLFSVVVADI
jgi:hypothetical protein